MRPSTRFACPATNQGTPPPPDFSARHRSRGGPRAMRLRKRTARALLVAVSAIGLSPGAAEAQTAASFSGGFVEAEANNGSVTGTLTLTISGNTFVADAQTDCGVSSTPNGLGFAIIRANDTQITLTYTGNAESHDADFNVTFQCVPNQALTTPDTGVTLTHTFTIDFFSTLTAPPPPAAPTVAATVDSSTSLDVSWTEPDHDGPVTSYDLQYREGRTGPYTAGPQDVTGTSAAIAGLQADTEYQVQVRAGNSAGDSDWSFRGEGDTNPDTTTPTVTGVTINDKSGSDTFELGDTITVQVSYGEDVDVTGTPRLALDIGGTTKYAAYDSGDSRTSFGILFFDYTVQAGDNDADGVGVPGPIDLAPDAMGQDTATIFAGRTTFRANLALGTQAIANSANHKVSTPKPELTISTTTATVTEGDAIAFTLTRSDTSGAASFNVNFNVTGGAAFGLADSPPSYSDTYSFADGVATVSDTLSTTNDRRDEPDGTVTITLVAGNSYTAGSTGNSVSVTVEDNDSLPAAPAITSLTPGSLGIEIVWAPGDLGLVDGAAADFGQDVLTVDLQTRCLGTGCLIYDFETGEDVLNNDWIEVFFNLSGAARTVDIRPLLEDTAYEIRMRVQTAAGAGPWSAVATGRTLSPDAPKVTDIAITSSPADGGDTYVVGETISVSVEWNSELDVTGTPRPLLGFGRTDIEVRWADYSASDSHPAGQENTSILVFKYTVQAGDSAPNGISVNDRRISDAVSANGGSIKVHCSYFDIHGGTQDGMTIEGNPDCVAEALFADLRVSSTGNNHEILNDENHKVDGISDVTPPALSAATVKGSTLALVYDEALDAAHEPAATAFTVTVAGSTRSLADMNPVAISGSTVTLTLASEVAADATVTVSYAQPTDTDHQLQDAATNKAAAFSSQAVAIDNTVPALRWATVRDTTLTLIYDEALDASSVPETNAFAVTAHGSSAAVVAVAVADRMVTLTLDPKVTMDPAMTMGPTVTLDYTVPDSNPIQDVVGNHAAALDDQAVANSTGKAAVIAGISITSEPASGDTYRIDETITVEVGFTPPVRITGTLDLDLEIGDYSRPTVCSDGGTVGPVTVLSCSYTVQPGDIEDDGVFILGNGLLPRAGAAVNTVDGGAPADLTFSTVRPEPPHKVNGGAIAPTIRYFRFDSFSTPRDDETFHAGETIRVLAVYHPRVDVTGTPRVGLRIGTQTRYANFVPFGDGGSDASVGTSDPETWLFFDYTVRAGDLDEDGIHVPAGSIDLNGGSIAGVLRETPAALAHGAIRVDGDRKVNGGPASTGGGGGGGGTNPPPSTGGGGGTSSPPALRTQLEPLTVAAGETADVDLRTAFRNARTFTAASSDPAAAAVEVTSGGRLRVTGLGRGFALVTVTAAGANGAEASQTMAVTVTGPARALLLPPANDELGRQGFVRIVNHGDAAGEVAVEAIDDTGRSAGTVTVPVPANGAAHFNSTDLEDGNPAKGIEDGVGPGLGGWRLVLDSDLAFTALSYIRTQDGFVTSMHDAAPAAPEGGRRIAFFNPASNWRQVSSLRLVNPGADRAQVTVTGVDDAGAAPDASVAVEVPAGGAARLTADELEAELGDGAGKWRLEAASDQPVAAMSLLESPSGHLTNLSTIPMRPEDGRHVVPFLPPASDPHGRQGFVRVANRSDQSGTATIRAFDDAGTDYGTLTLSLDAGETAHFNTHDLEVGSAAKGLAGSTGPAVDGGWRLALESGLELDVLAYVRHPDGFVTTMHDLAPAGDDGPWVAFLNPASNWRQVSLLRLVNPGDRDASVTLMGTDDAGAPGRRFVFVTVPAGTSRTLSSVDLEEGAEGLRGAFGDGAGKWRVRVSSRVPVLAMSLLESPTGHLTNLSTAPQRGAR